MRYCVLNNQEGMKKAAFPQKRERGFFLVMADDVCLRELRVQQVKVTNLQGAEA